MIIAETTVGGVDVSRETYERLQCLCGLISKWTKSINLIAPASVDEVWTRHIVDSAQLYHLAGEDWSSWVDLGSGGGLPGLVIAILDQCDRKVTLVESDTRKCLFLKTARRELNLNVDVLNERIEALTIEPADIVSARALAPLSDILGHAKNLMSSSGKALFLKGARYKEELDVALKAWQIDLKLHPSLTHPDAQILEISRISRREP